MGLLAVMGEGRPGTRGGSRESGGGVEQKGGAIKGGSGAGRDARPGLRAGHTKLET